MSSLFENDPTNQSEDELLREAQETLAELRSQDNAALLDGGTRINPDLIVFWQRRYELLRDQGLNLHTEQIGRSTLRLIEEGEDPFVRSSLIARAVGEIQGIEDPIIRERTREALIAELKKPIEASEN